MTALGIILARGGSKGLRDKCIRPLLGRPMICYTFDHAQRSKRLGSIVLTTDSEPAKALARAAGIAVVDRPADLANDTATVDAAARHAILAWECKHRRTIDAAVLLYGNIPIRAEGLIDRAIEHLFATQADSVRSVAPVTKQHPDWVHRLEGDQMHQFRPNSIYRRQDLVPLCYHDGAVVAVTRAALFGAKPDDHQSFLGRDRRAIVQAAEDAVDVDGPVDLLMAEAVLRSQAAADSNDPPEYVRVGNRRIGRGQPAFIIAEAGVNHDGSVETALKLVDAAAEAGADAVKFQWFRAADLVAAEAATAAYQRAATGDRSQRDMLSKLQLSPDQFGRIKQQCVDRGVTFLATPFGIQEAGCVAQLGAPAIKLASTDLANWRLIDAAIDTGLPLIASTGAATEHEICEAVMHITAKGARTRLILLHCVSCYPTPIDRANLRAIAQLADMFRVPVGFSDHTTSADIGAYAVAAGACILEKHFTLNRRAAGPDHAISLEPSQLSEYIRRVREVEAGLGSGNLGLCELEKPVRDVARRSVVSAVDIPSGSLITQSMLISKRPGTGIPSEFMASVVGRRTRQSISADALLAWDMLE
jgi:sialic acid synthase SpsE/CMP-N-acetylneuraminic acid synthetase